MLIAGNPLSNVATAQLERVIANAKNTYDWAISSQAAVTAEGSTTIPSGSRAQAGSKRMASSVVGMDEGDIASTRVRALESQQQRLVRKKMYGSSCRAKRSRSLHNSSLHTPRWLYANVGPVCNRSFGLTNASPCVVETIQQTVLIAGNPLSQVATTQLERVNVTAKNTLDWVISSQAAVTAEGSTTRAEARSTQESAKRTATTQVVDDIV